MDPLEEQQQELEVLELIYPDELHRFSDSHFQVSVLLDTDSSRKHTLVLDVKYPEEYPNVVPIMSVSADLEPLEEDSDSDRDEDERQVQLNINLSEQVDFSKADMLNILEKLDLEAQLQVGLPLVFALVTMLKDEGEDLFKSKVDALEKNREDELSRQEAEMSKKFVGTKVTKELFQEWRDKFRKEMGINDKLAQFYASQHQGKMSGREIFEKGLAGDELDELAEPMTELKV